MEIFIIFSLSFTALGRLGHPNLTLTPVDRHSLQIEIDPDANLRKLYGDALKYRVVYGKEHEAFRVGLTV